MGRAAFSLTGFFAGFLSLFALSPPEALAGAAGRGGFTGAPRGHLGPAASFDRVHGARRFGATGSWRSPGKRFGHRFPVLLGSASPGAFAPSGYADEPV